MNIFYNELNKFCSLKPQKESTKEKKATVYDNALGMYNMYLETYSDQYMALSKRKLGNKYDPVNLFLERYNYEDRFKNEGLADATRKSDTEESVDLFEMPPLEDDQEVKEVKGLKILTPNNTNKS